MTTPTPHGAGSPNPIKRIPIRFFVLDVQPEAFHDLDVPGGPFGVNHRKYACARPLSNAHVLFTGEASGKRWVRVCRTDEYGRLRKGDATKDRELLAKSGVYHYFWTYDELTANQVYNDIHQGVFTPEQVGFVEWEPLGPVPPESLTPPLGAIKKDSLRNTLIHALLLFSALGRQALKGLVPSMADPGAGKLSGPVSALAVQCIDQSAIEYLLPSPGGTAFGRIEPGELFAIAAQPRLAAVQVAEYLQFEVQRRRQKRVKEIEVLGYCDHLRAIAQAAGRGERSGPPIAGLEGDFQDACQRLIRYPKVTPTAPRLADEFRGLIFRECQALTKACHKLGDTSDESIASALRTTMDKVKAAIDLRARHYEGTPGKFNLDPGFFALAHAYAEQYLVAEALALSSNIVPATEIARMDRDYSAACGRIAKSLAPWLGKRLALHDFCLELALRGYGKPGGPNADVFQVTVERALAVSGFFDVPFWDHLPGSPASVARTYEKGPLAKYLKPSAQLTKSVLGSVKKYFDWNTQNLVRMFQTGLEGADVSTFPTVVKQRVFDSISKGLVPFVESGLGQRVAPVAVAVSLAPDGTLQFSDNAGKAQKLKLALASMHSGVELPVQLQVRPELDAFKKELDALTSKRVVVPEILGTLANTVALVVTLQGFGASYKKKGWRTLVSVTKDVVVEVDSLRKAIAAVSTGLGKKTPWVARWLEKTGVGKAATFLDFAVSGIDAISIFIDADGDVAKALKEGDIGRAVAIELKGVLLVGKAAGGLAALGWLPAAACPPVAFAGAVCAILVVFIDLILGSDDGPSRVELLWKEQRDELTRAWQALGLNVKRGMSHPGGDVDLLRYDLSKLGLA